jgi:glycosyltransferase involved in cell wall biosynthesis
LNFCTVIAKNYLAFARVLARSLAAHHPDGRVWTLIIDDFARYIDPADEPFEVLTPAEIGCTPFNQMAVRYSVLELSTAVKPWLLRHLMGVTDAPVTYLDPDIKVYDRLDRLDELAARHGMVLIPHGTEAIPPDGLSPSQLDIMKAGVYNLGYVTVSPRHDVERLLDWWAERLRVDCRVDPASGYFVDQRWLDLAPGFLDDYAIVRDPEYDVAYWNLASRRFEFDNGGYRVNGRSLGFFHFSAFDPEHPLILSRFQDRIEVGREPALERLLSEYAAELIDAGHRVARDWPYSYAVWGDGIRPDELARELYDKFSEERGDRAPSPFSPDGMRAFTDWLATNAPGAPPGVNRVLARVYEERPDIQGFFPDLIGSDGPRLVHWAREDGVEQIPLLARVMAKSQTAPIEAAAPAPAPNDLSAPMRQDPWGVNVVGYFRSELGVAEVARQVVSALDAKGVRVLPVHGQHVPLSRQGHSFVTATPDEATFPVNVICINADMLPGFAGEVGDDFFVGRYSIGLWFWEVASFPERLAPAFSLVEEVWAPTAHIAAALEPLATVPISTIRMPVQPPPLAPLSRADLGLAEDGFQFLFSFDFLSVFRRKNPVAVAEAFALAFAPGEGARLVLKCINAEHDPQGHAQLRAAAAAHPDIEIVDRYFSAAEKNSLTALCDCYVSLHRAEGFGLGMAEAMYYGKPVIATGYSGNLDFMTPRNGLLVDHDLVAIGDGAGPYPAEGEWANPSVEHAASLMRQVFDDRDGARALGARAARDIRRSHSPGAAGDVMCRRLDAIRMAGRTRRAGDPARRRPAWRDPLASQLQHGPELAIDREPFSARDRARRSALGPARPFILHQRGVNAAVFDALDDLNAQLAKLRLQASIDRTRWLQTLRWNDELTLLAEAQAQTIAKLEQDLDREADRGRTGPGGTLRS